MAQRLTSHELPARLKRRDSERHVVSATGRVDRREVQRRIRRRTRVKRSIAFGGLCVLAVVAAVTAKVSAVEHSVKTQVLALGQRIARQAALVQHLGTRYEQVEARVAEDRLAERVATERLRQIAVHNYTKTPSERSVPQPAGSGPKSSDARFLALVLAPPQNTKVAPATLSAALVNATRDEHRMQAVATDLRKRRARAEAELARLTGHRQAADVPQPPATAPPVTQPTAPPAPPPPPPPPPVYQNPLRALSSLVPERIDQGVDYSGSGPIYAVGKGVVLSTTNGGWPGGTYISYRLSEGPASGLVVYAAESINPRVSVGDTVDSGTVIGNVYEGATGIEVGWSDGSGDGNTLARSTGVSGGSTACGLNFSKFLVSLGAPGGNLESSVTGSLPSSLPSW